MIAPLDVIRLDSNEIGVCISTVDSLLEALNVIRRNACGKYVIYSQKTERRRFYELTRNGIIVFCERDELAVPGR